ncbi:cytochrome P450 3A8-like isoform X2 [Uloborus diversus]|uniref:cytochrome P450 3A8-like isoform X2 n=2 Tax=Uloborus diversus TaxID=327109 RepID=UPI00240A6EAF|nr:cytochrome P450 3A8-like isoform X2 [Uloborus diversus]
MEGLDFYSWIAIITAVIGIAVTSYIWYSRRNDDYWKKRGVKSLPRFNYITLYKILTEKPLHEVQLENYKKHGRILGSIGMGNKALSIADPELLKDILVKDFHVFHFRRELKFGDKIFDNMVSVLKGDDWKRVRTILTPVFTTKRLKMMTNIINECSQNVINEFDKKQSAGGTVDVKRMFGTFTLDVIARAAFATKINSLNDPENIFLQHAKSFFGNFSLKMFIITLIFPTWLVRKLRLGSFDSSDFFRDVIINVIKERKEKGKRYNDILQLLIDALDEDVKGKANKETPKVELVEDEEDQYGSIVNKETNFTVKYKKLSQDEMMAQCVLFFVVGYETTAAALSFMAYALALNPECQEKLIKEIDSAFENHKEMSYDTIRDMKYLDCVLSETLRLYPPVIASERSLAEDYELRGTGITIEKDVIINFPIYAMHLDPEFFPEPEKFKPERFIEIVHPQYAYLPFGAGPRNCLGMRFALMEIKLCISNILRHYRFHLADSTKVPLDYKKGVGFLAVNELPLKVEKRTDV